MATTPTQTTGRQSALARLNWLAAIIIGAVAVLFGIYLLFAPDSATTLIVAVISIALLLASLIHMLIGFRRDVNEFAARLALFTGGVGITVGAIVGLDIFYDYLDTGASRAILAGGLIVYGVLGLVGLVFSREQGLILRTIVACVAALAFAALLLLNVGNQHLHAAWFGIALIVAGLILIGVGYLVQSRRQPQMGDSGAGGGRSRRFGLPGRGDRGAAPTSASSRNHAGDASPADRDPASGSAGSHERNEPIGTDERPLTMHDSGQPLSASQGLGDADNAGRTERMAPIRGDATGAFRPGSPSSPTPSMSDRRTPSPRPASGPGSGNDSGSGSRPTGGA